MWGNAAGPVDAGASHQTVIPRGWHCALDPTPTAEDTRAGRRAANARFPERACCFLEDGLFQQQDEQPGKL